MSDDAMRENEEAEFVPDDEGIFPDAEKKIKKLRDELAQSEKERREYLEGWQRAKADFINYKKDEGKRLEDLMRFASAGLAEDILPVLDSFDLALGHRVGQETEKGIILIRSQLTDILKKRGMEEIVVNIGDPFDPESHESIGDAVSEYPAGAIAEVSQKGYAYSGRVLRPARVKLSKSPNE